MSPHNSLERSKAAGLSESGFLTDLATAYAELQPNVLSPTFLSDLQHIHSVLEDLPGVDFQFLTNHFDAWRQRTEQQVRLYREKLPPDDPIRCPVSLFRTMDYGRLETAHTRALAWLLNPRGEHGFGDKLLAALLRHLIAPSSFHSLAVERVESEYPVAHCPTDGRGRLDVFAEGQWSAGPGKTDRWTLVIEAKIDAAEGDGQLAKYDAWLRNRQPRAGEVLPVILTPGERPAEAGSEHWAALSYLDLIRVFRQVYSELTNTEGFHFLRFYLAGVMQDICAWPRTAAEAISDPYSVLSYLRSAHQTLHDGNQHDHLG